MAFKTTGTVDHDKLLFTFREEKNFFPLMVVPDFFPHKRSHVDHKHDFYELIIVKSGSGTSFFNDEEVKINNNEYVLIFPDRFHHYAYSPDKIQEDFAFYNILFYPEVFEMSGSFKPDLKYFNFNNLLSREKGSPFFKSSLSGQDYSQILDLAARMLHAEDYKPCAYKSFLYGSFFQLLATLDYHLDKQRRKEKKFEKSGIHPVVVRCIGILDREYHTRLYLPELAERLNISPNYLSRIFKQEMDTTIVQYLNTVRINQACELLAETKISINDIAHTVGFEEQAYFTRQFKIFKKITPQAFRKNAQGN